VPHGVAQPAFRGRRAAYRAIGARKVDVWLGTDGLVQHDVEKLAVVVIEALRPLLTTKQARYQTARLYEEGVLAPRLTFDPNDW
jgi:hypothetical protein